MGLFSISKGASPQTATFKELVAQYKRLRPVRMRLNDLLAGRLSKEQIDAGAKRLGMLRRGMIVFNSESEMPVLADYCIYEVYQQGRNAIEQYLCECPPDPDSVEMTCLRAMQHSTYTTVAIMSVEPGVGCRIRDMFTEEEHLLVDMGLAQSGEAGAVFVTRLLDFGDFVTTTGAALPMGVLNDEQLDDMQQTFHAAAYDADTDPGHLIRGFLEHGAAECIRYAGTEPQHLSEAESGGKTLFVETPALRQQTPRKRRAAKALSNRRCRCGSGKMFKNCCGNR